MLRRLQLRNIFQHREFDCEFGPGLIGIFGPNGSGKTNLLRAACAALTGSFPAELGRSASHQIRYGAADDEPAELYSEWEMRGQRFSLRHDVRTGERRLSYDGHEYRAAADIREQLGRMLGFPDRLIPKIVFVPQWEIFSILTATNAERLRLLQELLNLEQFERIWKSLGDAMRALESMLSGPSEEQIMEHQRLWADAETERQRREAALDDWNRRKPSLAQTRGAQETLQQHEQYCRLRAQLDIYEQQLEELRVQQQQDRMAWNQAAGQKREAAVVLRRSGCRGPDEMDVWLRTQRERLVKHMDRVRARRELASMPPPPSDVLSAEELRDLGDECDRCVIECRRLLEKWDEMRQRPAVCPTCGQPWRKPPPTAEELAEAQERYEHAQRQCDDLKARLKLEQARYSELQRWQAIYAERERRCRALGEDDGKVLSDEELQTFQNALDTWRSANAATAHARQQYRRSSKAYARHARRLAALDAEMERLCVSDEQVEAAKRILERERQWQQQAENLKRAVDDQRKLVRFYRSQLLRMESAAELAGEARRWHALFGCVRALVHRDQLPHRLMIERICELARLMNGVLGAFGSPFQVRIDDDLQLAVNARGEWESIHRKSGGEKVILAIAFRWAVQSLFAERLDMLVLDEPTAGLDSTNRRGLRAAFEELRRLCNNSQQQLIIVTHDDDLRNAFDQIVELA